MMKKALLFTILFFFSTLTFAQINYAPLKVSDTEDSAMNKVISGLKSLSEKRIIEKAYLHLDKPYYYAGDTIYFKAYVTYGEKQQLSPISKVLYVDLINNRDEIGQTLKIMLTDGIGIGSFNVPDSAVGKYRLRAYTLWMRNFDNAYFFNKTINIISSDNNKPNLFMQPSRSLSASTTSIPPAVINMEFFPEGGEMVAGLQSKIAFKAIGSNGLGVDVKGVIKDDQNNAVADFASTHSGIGAVEILPQPGRNYHAIIMQPSGFNIAYNLPVKKDAGIVLSVKIGNPKKIAVEIAVNQLYFNAHKNEIFNLVIYQAGIVKIVKTKLDARLLGLDIPVNNFKTGIVQITIFSPMGEPLNERLVFINNPNQIGLKLDSLKPVYHDNEKVMVNLNVKGISQQPDRGNFSVAVVRENQTEVQQNFQSNILTHLLLTSNLNGYVEQPDYYFANNSPETSNALDLLMLTQNYSRYTWKELLNNTFHPVNFSPEKALQISGSVSTTGNAPVVNAKVMLFAQLDESILATNTDRSGRFIFPNLIFADSTRFIITAKTSGNKDNVRIRIDSSDKALAVISSSTEPGTITSSNLLPKTKAILVSGPAATRDTSSVIKTQKNILLKTVTVKGYKDDNTYRSSVIGGAGHADQVMHAKDLEGMGTMVAALNGRLRGVTFVNGIPYLSSSLMMAIGANIAKPMLVVVDGIQYATMRSSDPSSPPPNSPLSGLTPDDVETVEVLKSASASIYGVNGGGGVLAITTKLIRSKEPDKGTTQGMTALTAHGFYKSKSFFAPSKINRGSENSGDKNITVYWNPNLVTDANGNIAFQYFNTGGKGNYKIVIEGIDTDGNIARTIYHYQVQ